MLRRLLTLFCLTIAAIAVTRFCKRQTGSFTLARISSSLSYRPEWETDAPSPELKSVLNQPYTYLAKGAQAFVFASEDGKYVIKFFRHHHMSAPFWLRAMPFEWAQDHRLKKEAKLAKDFGSYKLAYDRFKSQTGLVFLHLNKTSDLHITLDLVDKLGIHHSLALDQYEFLVQQRAQLVFPALEEMMKKGQEDEARSALSNLVHLLQERMRNGIVDKDPDLNTNFGFIGTQPVQIDFGRYKPKTPFFDKPEIVRITDNLHQWLMSRYPELDAHLRQELDHLPDN
jgi:hypothetical protein